MTETQGYIIIFLLVVMVIQLWRQLYWGFIGNGNDVIRAHNENLLLEQLQLIKIEIKNNNTNS